MPRRGSATRSPSARVVWLDVEVDDAWERVSATDGVRPLARDPQRFEQLYEQRRPLYEELADVIVPGAGPDRSREVLAATEGLPHGYAA